MWLYLTMYCNLTFRTLYLTAATIFIITMTWYLNISYYICYFFLIIVHLHHKIWLYTCNFISHCWPCNCDFMLHLWLSQNCSYFSQLLLFLIFVTTVDLTVITQLQLYISILIFEISFHLHLLYISHLQVYFFFLRLFLVIVTLCYNYYYFLLSHNCYYIYLYILGV